MRGVKVKGEDRTRRREIGQRTKLKATMKISTDVEKSAPIS